MAYAARRRAAHSHAARPSLIRFPVDRRGVTAIEYAMIASIISIVILTAIISIRGSLERDFSSVLTGFQ